MTDLGGALWTIDGPLPEKPPFTLIDAARAVVDVDRGVERWPQGVEVFPYPSGPALAWDPCSAGSSRVKAPGERVAAPRFGGFVAYLEDHCSTLALAGAGSQEERERAFLDYVNRAFAAVESAGVEREFMSGDVLSAYADHHYLADGNVTFPWGSNPTSPTNALAVLENEIARSGRRGMIHMTPGLAAVLDTRLHLDERSNPPVLRTINGTPVVPGYGYVGARPPQGEGDTGPTEEWAYATGPVEVRRSLPFVTPETLAEATDRATNELSYVAERAYVVDWDTAVQAAVLVDLCSTTCGTPPS
jgi:hypothetical protein